MATFRSEMFGSTRGGREYGFARVRELAAAKAAELNAKHEGEQVAA
jgi:hypothetical protein